MPDLGTRQKLGMPKLSPSIFGTTKIFSACPIFWHKNSSRRKNFRRAQNSHENFHRDEFFSSCQINFRHAQFFSSMQKKFSAWRIFFRRDENFLGMTNFFSARQKFWWNFRHAEKNWARRKIRRGKRIGLLSFFSLHPFGRFYKGMVSTLEKQWFKNSRFWSHCTVCGQN